jgi:osmotically-inducible protein OsmY
MKMLKVLEVTPRRSLLVGTAFFLLWGTPVMAQAGSSYDPDTEFSRDRDFRGYDYHDLSDPDYHGPRDYRGARDYSDRWENWDTRDNWETRENRNARDERQDREYTDAYGDVDTIEEQANADQRRENAYLAGDSRIQDRKRSSFRNSSRESQRDRRLKSEVQQAVEDLNDGESNRINVHVRDGNVRLVGTVEDRDTLIEAEKHAYDAGARNVENDLDIVNMEDHPWTQMSDDELRDEIQSEFTWSPSVDGDQIGVQVRDGVAVLEGNVEDESEMVAAVKNAYEAGARRVINHMRIMKN